MFSSSAPSRSLRNRFNLFWWKLGRSGCTAASYERFYYLFNICRKYEHSGSQVVSQISEVANNMITFDDALINSPSPALIWGRSLGGTSGGEVPVWISSSPRSSICSPTSCSTSGRSPAGWTSLLSFSDRGALSSTRSQSWSWAATVGHQQRGGGIEFVPKQLAIKNKYGMFSGNHNHKSTNIASSH